MSVDPDEKMKRRVATEVLEAANPVDALIQSKNAAPETAAFYAALNRLQGLWAAQAEVLAKAIELLAPLMDDAIDRRAELMFPGRGTLALGFKTTVDLSWLKLKGGFVATAPVELDDRGATLYRDLFLLEDGRLIELTQLGRESPGATPTAVLGSRTLEPIDAVKQYDWVLILASMDGIARKASADPEERRTRFRALVESAAQAIMPATEALDAAVRPG